MAKRKVGAIAPAVITRDEAKALGLKDYFTGEPCKRGHIAPRRVKCSVCHECSRGYSRAWAAKNKAKMAKYGVGYRIKNRDRETQRFRVWKEQNPGWMTDYYKERNRQNPDRLRKYRAENSEHRAAQSRAWRERNKERFLASVKAYAVKRMAEDLNFKLATRLRQRLKTAVRKGARSGAAVRELGCSIPELREHLQRQFVPGMSWENWGRWGWHIDHIRPLASFDLTDPEQLRQACHYTNLQPLWHAENASKGARTDWKRVA